MQPIQPLLMGNPYMVVLLLFYVLVNILSWVPDGVMRQQLVSLRETRNARTFELGAVQMSWLIPLLILQLFIFLGLHIYLYVQPDAERSLESLERADMIVLALCTAIPTGWFVLQWLSFSWWGYLFRESDRLFILGRVYLSVHLMASTPTMLLFLAEVVGLIDYDLATILLSLIFIIIQIAFIFNGIKIFWGGIGTLCFIFLYLCAFIVAPILVLWDWIR